MITKPQNLVLYRGKQHLTEIQLFQIIFPYLRPPLLTNKTNTQGRMRWKDDVISKVKQRLFAFYQHGIGTFHVFLSLNITVTTTQNYNGLDSVTFAARKNDILPEDCFVDNIRIIIGIDGGLAYFCILLDYRRISCHYIYGSNAVKVFASSYCPQDIDRRNYTYNFSITVDNR